MQTYKNILSGNVGNTCGIVKSFKMHDETHVLIQRIYSQNERLQKLRTIWPLKEFHECHSC